MDDLNELEAQIRQRVAAAQTRRQRAQQRVTHAMTEHDRRLNQFKAVAKRLLHKVIFPRLKVLEGLFSNARLTLGGERTVHRCECAFDRTPEYPATTKLSITVLPDDAIKSAVIHYKLEILPVYFEFDHEDEFVFSLDELKEQSVATWLDAKLLAFTDTYLKLQLVPQYQEENIVVDPVCGMRINKTAATASMEHDGKAYYFCVDECQQKFIQDPMRYLARR
jgi:YHS domain-containing protein